MPPVCTPEKFNNVQCPNAGPPQQYLEYITPPLNTNKNLIKKTDLIYMEKMQNDLPTLSNIFDIHKKIGEGTFSTVFLASLLNDVNNEKQFAIKYLVPTTHPKRIEVELHCLKQIGGVDNVAGINLCLREKDNIVFVMPYLQHDHFTDYAKDMDVKEVALYIKSLLIALKRVHSFGIIHRDVKPNNFLYDRTNKKFLLIDFGLAQLCSSTQNSSVPTQKRKREIEENEIDQKVKIEPAPKRRALQSKNLNNLTSIIKHFEKYENNGSSCKENITSNVENIQTVFKEPKELFKSPIKINNSIRTVKKSPFKFPGLDLPPTHSSMLNKKDHHQRRLFDEESPVVNLKNKLNKVKTNLLLENDKRASLTPKIEVKKPVKEKYCTCYGKPKICNICIVRKGQEASRAGTPGFRPPEVLLKYDKQTTAVDIWAVGVIMLSFLSKSYPFFHAPDDVSALAEIITVFGDEQVKKLAKIFGRDLICSERKSRLDLRKICCRLRSRGKVQTNKSTIRCIVCTNYMHLCLCPGVPAEDMEDIFPASAYDLLERLLDINPFTRITATQALNHPFLADL